jgi:hypothetical protein
MAHHIRVGSHVKQAGAALAVVQVQLADVVLLRVAGHLRGRARGDMVPRDAAPVTLRRDWGGQTSGHLSWRRVSKENLGQEGPPGRTLPSFFRPIRKLLCSSSVQGRPAHNQPLRVKYAAARSTKEPSGDSSPGVPSCS